MKPRISLPLLKPPSEGKTGDLSRSAEIEPQFVEEILGLRRLPYGREIVEDVIRLL